MRKAPFMSAQYVAEVAHRPPSTPTKDAFERMPIVAGGKGGAKKSSKVPLWVLPLLAAPRFSWRRPRDRANGQCGAKPIHARSGGQVLMVGQFKTDCRACLNPACFSDFLRS